MKYVKNNGRYALTYTYVKGAKENKVTFDRLRVYMDTGNIATSGITAVEDDVFEALEENKAFADAMKAGTLILTEPAKDTAADELEKLRAENEKLQKKLDKNASAKELEKAAEEKAQLEGEVANLKAQLEALSTKADKDEEKKPEGF